MTRGTDRLREGPVCAIFYVAHHSGLSVFWSPVTIGGVIRTTNAQTLPLTDLTQGVTYHLVLTGGTGGASTLKFLHLADPALHNHPDHTAKAQADVILTTFICPDPRMTLTFATAPSADYNLSVLPITAPEQ